MLCCILKYFQNSRILTDLAKINIAYYTWSHSHNYLSFEALNNRPYLFMCHSLLLSTWLMDTGQD